MSGPVADAWPKMGTLGPCSKAEMGIHTGQVFLFSREARNLNFCVKSDLLCVSDLFRLKKYHVDQRKHVSGLDWPAAPSASSGPGLGLLSHRFRGALMYFFSPHLPPADVWGHVGSRLPSQGFSHPCMHPLPLQAFRQT